jgi:hypothetical protein
MLNTVSQNSIDDQTPSYKWDDEKIIIYYKRKAREICSQLEKEDEYKKKGLLNYVPRQFKPKLDFKFQNSKTISSEKQKVPKKNKIFPTKQETESVLNMLFPYVKEDHFKIEEFKTGSDLLRETRFKPNITIIKLNQEKRIKSNFNKKFKKYDKELNTYADTPSIRCSSAYTTEDQVYRRELIQSKLKWVVPEDFRRVFGRRTANDRIKEDTINNHVENDIYIEPFKIDRFRKMDKSKWVSKKNFIV